MTLLQRALPTLALALGPWLAPPLAAQTAAGAGAEWRVHHGDAAATRFSRLGEVHAGNVAGLATAWEWRSEQVLGEEQEFRNQSSPLMIDGVLYFTVGTERRVVAADARTGSTLWVWRLPDERVQRAPRANSGRGVAYWRDGERERLFVVTPGYRLASLDARTGQLDPHFGDAGLVDLKRVLGVEEEAVIGSSSPPVVHDGVVVLGPALAIGSRPPSRANAPGSILAFDARSGAPLWQFRTIPREGEPGVETWEDESWRYTGNTGAWAPFSLDERRGWLYLPIEAATGDYYGGHRPGDNLFSSSLVCVDVRTGRRIWHQQIVRHDIWDYDNPTAPILADLIVDGRPVEAVVQLTKQGFAYVFDRGTGEPVWPMEDRAVPASDVPGERAAATQPFPTRPAPYERQGITADDLIDFTPQLRAEALEAIRPFRTGPLFTPPSLEEAPDGTRGTLSLPGSLGGTNWEHAAFDPEAALLFVPSHTSPSVLGLISDPERSDMAYILGTGRVPTVQGLPIVKPPYTRITAIDLATGDHRWMVPAGDTPQRIREHPALTEVQLPRTGTPGARPVVMATRTLLFAGEGWGGEPMLRALDKRTGDTVHALRLDAPVVTQPITYQVDGRQYLLFWIGDARTDVRSRLVALKLPG